MTAPPAGTSTSRWPSRTPRVPSSTYQASSSSWWRWRGATYRGGSEPPTGSAHSATTNPCDSISPPSSRSTNRPSGASLIEPTVAASGLECLVPELQGVMVVLVAEDRQGTGIQAQQAGHPHLQAQVPGGQGPQDVPVAEQEHVVVGIADLGQETVGPGGDLLGRLASRRAVVE